MGYGEHTLNEALLLLGHGSLGGGWSISILGLRSGSSEGCKAGESDDTEVLHIDGR